LLRARNVSFCAGKGDNQQNPKDRAKLIEIDVVVVRLGEEKV
jgi:hypothetical protein